MNTKQKLGYMVVGGLLVAAGMIISPLNAKIDKFGEIVCTRLAVVDVEGNERIILGTKFLNEEGHPALRVVDANGEPRVLFTTDANGGSVVATGYDGKSAASLRIGERGGEVTAYGKDNLSMVALGFDELGGLVVAYGKDEISDAKLSFNEHGGLIGAMGNDGKSAALLGISQYGGWFDAQGGDGKSRAWLGTIERGGTVLARDRYGNKKHLD